MSRALDKETAAAARSDNLQIVYDDVVEAICSSTSSDLLEIEILGKSHPLPPGCNVLVDGNNIAVPKATLVQAFIVARQILFKYLCDLHERQQEIRNAAAVILLMDPEHVTAANARKRVVQTYQKRPVSELQAELARELWWVDSMLTARLHRHTKSPTLWGHRRWVLEVYHSLQIPHDIHRDLTSVVLIAAERHPRNYYAWLHMRWLLQNLHPNASRAGNMSVRKEAVFDNSKLISTITAWCLMHPADTAGFSFLLFCLFQHSGVLLGSKSRMEVSSSICQEVLDRAVSFKWTHESVWVFLRTLVASGVADEQRTAFFESIKTILGARPGNSQAQTTLQAAHDWCLEYERRVPS
jgi:protein prenyltransferase alpha subunit repeat containing protein 1